jgi:exopolyphosphatase/guanosine-5'-triphosphate,3'-diphosphate pyrophosphatase
MSEIIPRWEWRTFGHRFGAAEDVFAAMTPTDTADSDERYLIAPGADTVKVRFDLLDIKVLREVDPDGLERWEPVMKQAFPLPAADVAQVFALLGLARSPLARDTYSLDQFIRDFAAPGGALQPVQGRRLHLGGH